MVKPLDQHIRIRDVAGSGFLKYGSRRQGMSLPQGALQPGNHGLTETASGGPEQQRQMLQSEDGGRYETIGAEVILLISNTRRGEIWRIEVKVAGRGGMPKIATEDFLKTFETPPQ